MAAEVEARADLDLAVIDYGMGNLRSVCRALERAGASPRLVARPEEAADATAIVFPGQGAIPDAMSYLVRHGWDSYLRVWLAKDRPYLGICLGLQALFEWSAEGNTACLGVFQGEVLRFAPAPGRRIPHMGWNRALSPGIGPGPEDPLSWFYFVHSYYVSPEDPELIWRETDYTGTRFVSAIRKGNLLACQFHPEKSQEAGRRFYADWLDSLRRPATEATPDPTLA